MEASFFATRIKFAYFQAFAQSSCCRFNVFNSPFLAVRVFYQQDSPVHLEAKPKLFLTLVIFAAGSPGCENLKFGRSDAVEQQQKARSILPGVQKIIKKDT